MRFSQYLRENSGIDLHEAIKLIARDCQPFLAASKGLALYRGIKDAAPILDSPNPVGRKSVDMSHAATFMFNSMIDAAYNITDVRSKTIFASGLQGLALHFGQIYYIFPKGQIKYLWSDTIEDVYNQQNLVNSTITEHLPSGAQYNVQVLMRRMYEGDDIFKTSGWVHARHTADLGKTLYDILYTIPLPSRRDVVVSPATITAQLTHALQQAGLELYANSVNLDSAIKSGNEILIYESDGYYALRMDEVGKELIPGDHDVSAREQYEFLHDMILSV